jgi:hypothetical protein
VGLVRFAHGAGLARLAAKPFVHGVSRAQAWDAFVSAVADGPAVRGMRLMNEEQMVDSIEGLMLVRSRRRASLGPARSAKGEGRGRRSLRCIQSPCACCRGQRACQKMHGCRRS